MFSDGEFYRSLFEQHSAPMFIFSKTGKIIKANDAALKFYGYDKDEIESKYVYEINVLPKEKLMPYAYDAFEKKQNVFEFKHRLKNGDIKDVQVYSSPAEIGGQEYLLSIIHDVTRQTRYRQIFGAIKEISQAAINIDSEEELFKSLTGTLVEKAGFRAAFVMLPNRRNTKLVSAACHGNTPALLECIENTSIDLTSNGIALKTPLARAFLEGKIFINYDTETNESIEFLKKKMLENNCLSSICIPILKQSKPAGSLCICHEEPEFFEDYLDMFEDIKNTVSMALDRIEDVTEKKTLKNELSESEDLFKTLADQMQSGLVMYKEKFIYANEAFKEMLGYTWNELKDLGTIDMIAEDFHEDMKESIRKGLSDVNSRRFVELKAVKKTGEEFWIYAYAGSVRYKGDIVRITNIVNIDEMINMRQKLRQERDLMTTLVENIHSGVALYDKSGFLYANSFFLDMFGYNREEISGIRVGEFFDIEESLVYNSYSQIFKVDKENKISSRFVYMHASYDGEIRYMDLFRTTVPYNGKETGLAIFSDVTDEVLKEQSILKEKETFRELSEIDSLTGIGNRRAFNLRMEELFNLAKRYGRALSLIMIDIDYFKEINDTYGHEAGDVILKNIAAVSRESLRKSDFIARYGGEEFVIIAPETPMEAAENLAEKLRLKIRNYDFGTGNPVTVSLGVSSLSGGDTKQTLVYRADMAMYKAKENGRNRVERI